MLRDWERRKDSQARSHRAADEMDTEHISC